VQADALSPQNEVKKSVEILPATEKVETSKVIEEEPVTKAGPPLEKGEA